MDVFYVYTYGSAIWLGTQAFALILAPKLIIDALSSDEVHHVTGVEIYLSRSLGFVLVTMAMIMLTFTGTIPLSSAIGESVLIDDTDSKAPYALPIVRITSLLHALTFIYCYTQWVQEGPTGFALGMLGNAAVTVLGGWCLIFGGGSGRTSKRTGADKRMSGFPFKNVNQYDKKKDRKMG